MSGELCLYRDANGCASPGIPVVQAGIHGWFVYDPREGHCSVVPPESMAQWDWERFDGPFATPPTVDRRAEPLHRRAGTHWQYEGMMVCAGCRRSLHPREFPVCCHGVLSDCSRLQLPRASHPGRQFWCRPCLSLRPDEAEHGDREEQLQFPRHGDYAGDFRCHPCLFTNAMQRPPATTQDDAALLESFRRVNLDMVNGASPRARWPPSQASGTVSSSSRPPSGSTSSSATPARSARRRPSSRCITSGARLHCGLERERESARPRLQRFAAQSATPPHASACVRLPRTGSRD